MNYTLPDQCLSDERWLKNEAVRHLSCRATSTSSFSKFVEAIA